MSREKRAKDWNVTFRETISVWISLESLNWRHEMTLFRLQRAAWKICCDNFSHVRFAVMTTLWGKNTCVRMCLLLKLITKIKKEMSWKRCGKLSCRKIKQDVLSDAASEWRWLENLIFSSGKEIPPINWSDERANRHFTSHPVPLLLVDGWKHWH